MSYPRISRAFSAYHNPAGFGGKRIPSSAWAVEARILSGPAGLRRGIRALISCEGSGLTESDHFFAAFLSCLGILTSRLRTLFPLPLTGLHSVAFAGQNMI